MDGEMRLIIREIVSHCASRSVVINEGLAAFQIKVLLLDPANNFHTENILSPAEMIRLVEMSVHKLCRIEDIALQTAKMQVQFDRDYTSLEDLDSKRRRDLIAKLDDVEREISESRARSREELEGLYRKIVLYILVRSDLGSVTDITVVRETTAALESVLPPVELGSFILLAKKEKQKQLLDLTNIVTGIRLFNKRSGKGGNMIPDPTIASVFMEFYFNGTYLGEIVPSLIGEIGMALAAKLQEQYDKVAEQALRLASFICLHQGGEQSMDTMKDALINYDQYLTYLVAIQNDLEASSIKTAKAIVQITNNIGLLYSIVESKVAVPTDQVYPRFIALAEAWAVLQLEQDMLHHSDHLFAELLVCTRIANEYFSDSEASLPHAILPLDLVQLKDMKSKIFTQQHKKLVHQFETNSELQISQELAEPIDSLVPTEVAPMQLLSPSTTHGYIHLSAEFGGHCLVSLVQNVGFVVGINRGIGLLQYNGKVYGFRSKNEAQLFAHDPARYLEQVESIIFRKPELIALLRLQDLWMPASSSYLNRGIWSQQNIELKCDGGTQTELHPLQDGHDKKYEWNEWDLRRQALKLADLRTKKTSSSQTEQSNYRRETSTQVYLPKNSETQTKTDASTSIPKPVTYIQGLRGPRGAKSDTVRVVDLTLNVGGISLKSKPKQ